MQQLLRMRMLFIYFPNWKYNKRVLELCEHGINVNDTIAVDIPIRVMMITHFSHSPIVWYTLSVTL